ncbi:predicted protein [Plenodomus lingam JN3]|uniref:Predicted protein n=1 Tax=Leptosphaeria maculans (strain JN3 / isolate v23.1.3 / race Av1-4-5-6-7-8) TaxID=985895 RepID=E4ZJL8_LEPMJ|nr:predicted protein [Plenodomus lingam JN3]CBX91303.1 predicted protein [Plenodomus lingam JN3]
MAVKVVGLAGGLAGWRAVESGRGWESVLVAGVGGRTARGNAIFGFKAAGDMNMARRQPMDVLFHNLESGFVSAGKSSTSEEVDGWIVDTMYCGVLCAV